MKVEQISAANRDCIAKALPGEPMFVILGRDPDGGNIVRLWAERRKAAGDPEHANPVFAIADAMDAWAVDHKPDTAPLPEAFARYEASLSGGWEDIASAPKDGNGFLATNAEYDEDCEHVSFKQTNDDFCWSLTEGFVRLHRDRFTHWRPLPAPPASAETGK